MWRKKHSCGLMLVILLFTLFLPVSIYGVEYEGQEYGEVLLAEEYSNATKDGLYVNMGIGGYLVKDNLSIELKDASGKVLDTQVIKKSDVSVDTMSIALKFDYSDYKDGDTLYLCIPEIDGLSGFEHNGVKNGFEVELPVEKSNFLIPSETPVIDDLGEEHYEAIVSNLRGIKENPYIVTSIVARPETFNVVAVDASTGDVISNLGVTFEYLDGSKETKVSDVEGHISFPADIKKFVSYTSEDLKWSAVEKNQVYLNGGYEILLFNETSDDVIAEVNEANSHIASNFNIVVESDVSADLNTSFASFGLRLKDSKVADSVYDFELGFGLNNLKLPLGNYSVEVFDDTYCSVNIGATLEVKDNQNVSVIVTPKHILKVSKAVNGSPENYHFKVTNISSANELGYSGLEAKSFAVMPFQSIMVTDIDTDETYVVEVENAPETVLNLNGGLSTVSEKIGAPKTADSVTVLISLLVILLMLLVCGGLYLYKTQGKRKGSASLLSLFLVCVLLTSLAPVNTINVEAGVAGSGNGIGDKSHGKAASGTIGIMDRTVPILKVSLVDCYDFTSVCHFCNQGGSHLYKDDGTDSHMVVPVEIPEVYYACPVCGPLADAEKKACAFCVQSLSEVSMAEDFVNGFAAKESAEANATSFYLTPNAIATNAYKNGGILDFNEFDGLLTTLHGREPYTQNIVDGGEHTKRLIAWDSAIPTDTPERQEFFSCMMGIIELLRKHGGPQDWKVGNLKYVAGADLATDMNAYMYKWFSLESSTESTDAELVQARHDASNKLLSGWIGELRKIMETEGSLATGITEDLLANLQLRAEDGCLSMVIDVMHAGTDGWGTENCMYISSSDIGSASAKIKGYTEDMTNYPAHARTVRDSYYNKMSTEVVRAVIAGAGSLGTVEINVLGDMFNTIHKISETADVNALANNVNSMNANTAYAMAPSKLDDIDRCWVKNGVRSCSGTASCADLYCIRNGLLKEAMKWGYKVIAPTSTDVRANSEKGKIYGGWGFYAFASTTLPIAETYEPVMYAEMIVQEQLEDGSLSTPVTMEVPNWTKSELSKNRLSVLSKSNKSITTSSILELDLGKGLQAYIPKSVYSNITVEYVGDWNGREASSFMEVSDKVSVTNPDPFNTVMPDEDGVITYNFDAHNIKQLSDIRKEYCDAEDAPESRYFEQKKAGVFKVTIPIIVEKAPKVEPTAASDNVPQWRINKFYNGLHNLTPTKEYAGADWAVNESVLTKSTGCGETNNYSNQSSNRRFNIVARDIVDAPWFELYKANTNGKTSFNAKVKYGNTKKIKGVTANLLAWKTPEVDNIVTASWVKTIPNYLKNKGIEEDRENSKVTTVSDVISKNYPFAIGIDHTFSLTNNYYKRSHYWGICYCSIHKTESVSSFLKNDAVYDTTIDYQRYAPELTDSKNISASENKVDGRVEFTQQSSVPLYVYPEVPMMYSDSVGNNSVIFTVGELKRDFKPVSYHQIEYDIDSIEPSIVGTSVATDSKIGNLTTSLGVGNLPVIHKGAGTTTSYESNAEIVAKSYVLDIGNTSVKNAWGNSGYSSGKINEDFLSGFASQTASGDWVAELNAVENLDILDNLRGGVNQNITLTQNGSVDMTSYKLTVRAGEITKVNGNKNWRTSLPADVVNAIDNMALTHNGVFSSFVSGGGHTLDESSFETLTKSLRENSPSIEVGKGWYSEDTTVLTLNVFTTKFTIPNMLFANKIPQSIAGLEAKQNKAEFYSDGVVGHLQLDLKLVASDSRCSADLVYNTKNAYGWYANKKQLYVVPNVSITDTTLNQ